MDEWSKKKKAASNGGRGMCKYIDYEEQKRLSRLKNIRGSINIQHNSWQANQLEKRRKEQIRQRKRDEEAMKRRRAAETKKGGFLVDTTATGTAPYEFTKCGLKLRLEKSSSSSTTACSSASASGSEKRRTDVKRDEAKNNDNKSESKQLPLVSRYAIDSIELNRRKPPHVQKNVVKRKEQSCGGLPDPDAAGRAMNTKKKEGTNSIKPGATTQKQQQDSSQTANVAREKNNSGSCCSSISKGKENGDNPNRSSNHSDSENTAQASKQTSLTKGKLILQKKKPIHKKSSESYFMDFESLKREHADAIEMLKQLDEENKRLFARKDGDGLDIDAKWTDRKEEEDINDDVVEESSAVITLPEGMLCATHLSISLHDSIGDDYLQEQDEDDREVSSKPEAELSVDLGDEFDDESEAGHSNSICFRSNQETDNEDEADFVDWEYGTDTDVVLVD